MMVMMMTMKTGSLYFVGCVLLFFMSKENQDRTTRHTLVAGAELNKVVEICIERRA